MKYKDRKENLLILKEVFQIEKDHSQFKLADRDKNILYLSIKSAVNVLREMLREK